MSRKQVWPRYRIDRWIDVGQEAMDSEDDPSRFGIGIQTEKGGKWKHGYYNGKPAVYKTAEEASLAIKHLQGYGVGHD